MSGPVIGVLALQGDARENVEAAAAALGGGGEAREVRTPAEIDRIDGLIMPGGESTAIGRLSAACGALERAAARAAGGMPIFGICAGLVLLSRDAADREVGRTGQPLMGLLDARVERNAFGRQLESFEAEVSLGKCGIPRFPGVFIRAPAVAEAGPGVEVLAEHAGRTVAVRQGGLLGVAFHPELTGDLSLHRHFAGMVADAARGAG